MKKAGFVLIILILTVVVFYFSEIYLFSKVKENFELNTDPEIWSHRGVHNSTNKENTIPAFKEAVSKGFKGIEVDVMYFEPADRFLISHDELKGGASYDTLEKLFEELQNPDIGYWIDFKNSVFFNGTDNTSKTSLNRLKFLQDKYKLKKLYIETKNLIFADFLHINGIKSIYWITVEISDFFTFFNEKIALTQSKFDAVSIDNIKITPEFLKAMKGIPIFTFTVNDESHIKTLASYDNIQIILTDNEECDIGK